MKKKIPGFLLFPAIIFIIYGAIFSYSHLLGVDIMEARNFVTAREMVKYNNWLIPTMNGELRLEKPPLPTWVTAIAMKMAGSDANLAANRLPAGLAALLLLFFFYRFMLLYSSSKCASVTAVLVLSTSYMFMYMSRRGTWDIFCHAFVTGAIWALYKAVSSSRAKSSWFVAAGILTGLSFMSKGPVSVYSLLLPFLLSEFINGERQKYLRHWKMLLISLVVALLVSGVWPVYLHLTVPGAIQQTAITEFNAWGSRHVKSFLWYLQFPAVTGIWVFFALPALWLPHSRRVTNEDFPIRKILTWVLLSFILLSILPEKKARYLLPMTIPLAALLGGYISALMSSNGNANRTPRLLCLYNFLAVIFLSASIVTGIYYFTNFGVDLYMALISIASLAMLIKLSKILLARQQPDLIYIILSFIFMIQVAGPLASIQIGPDDFMVFKKLRGLRLSTLKIYSGQIHMIKIIWACGRRIYQWKPGAPPKLENDEKILLLTLADLQTTASIYGPKGYLILPEHEIVADNWNLFQVSQPAKIKRNSTSESLLNK